MKDFLNYKLESMIGEGGFGQVWSARDKHTGEEVAIKFNNNKITQQ